jgi:tetratricopeptide (TPR) repeat protein
MQLDPGNVELGGVETLAFSPDGTRLLAGGQIAAFWSARPIVWNDPARAAQKLQLLRQSNADFQSRIRMFSENLRLHEALAKLDSQDKPVHAALAATQANWQASRNASPEAVAAFDRLLAADPHAPQDWLRTPGHLRLATVLLQQNRPVEAAALLSGGAKRRSADGLSAAVDRAGLGVTFSLADGQVQVAELLTGFPTARSDLRPGDVILKVNDTELTRESHRNLSSLLAGIAGTTVRLTIRRSGSDQPQVIELTREQFVHDPATGELLHPLRAAINAQLGQEPQHPGLLELRAELAGQWSDPKAQVADYTAAIHSLTAQTTRDAAADLQRLYARRGTAHIALKQWPEAVADFAQVITPETTDEQLLANQALALAEATPVSEKWTALKPVEMTSAGGATLTLLEDDSILVGGDNPQTDVYTLAFAALPASIQALRLEVLPHESLPQSGPGRHQSGKFVLTTFKAEVDRPANAAGPRILKLARAWADHSDPDGNVALAIDTDENTGWSTLGDVGQQHVAVFELDQPIAASDAATLRVSLEFKHPSGQTGLGRFRLSAISDPLLLDQVKKRFAARELSDPWQKLAVVYQLEGQQPAIDQLVERRPQLASRIGAVFSQNEDWSRAVEVFSRGITPATTDVELLSNRARAYEGLKNWEAAAADWTRAAAGNPNGAKLLADFALRLAEVEQLPLSRTVRQEAQRMLEQALQADPGDSIVAEKLAELLLSASPADSARLGSVSDPWLRLAVGYALSGETEPATKYFAAALDAAPAMEAEQPIVREASRFEVILAALHQQRPHDSLLQLALAKNLAKQGLKFD